jgi:peptidoglycan LD-endopeptidase LytH
MTKKIFFIALIINVLSFTAVAQTSTSRVINSAVANFHFLYQSIRNGDIDENTAKDSVKHLLPELLRYYMDNQGKPDADSAWIFPVAGYGINMIGGRKGSDYIPGKYRFYNVHGNSSHPAHDIFINDKNQDNLDDETNDYVKVLSMTGGIVVSSEHFWDTTMTAKGGNYVYIYEPFSKKLYYYAHNDVLWVGLGDIVAPGQHIANMGRTGLNAYKKRSPTHLHFSMLRFDDNGEAEPVKPYTYLAKARNRTSSF